MTMTMSSEAKTAHPSQLEFFMTESEVAEHWRLKPHTLRNARYRGEWLPYVKHPAGSIRYRVTGSPT